MKKFDYKTTIFSQFQNAKTLNYMLSNFVKILHIGKEEVLENIADVDKAHGIFLDVIGSWVGASRTTDMLLTDNDDFGFDDDSWFGFDNPEGGTLDKKITSGAVTLNDTAFRLLIKMTAYKNITNCSIVNLNYLLSILFEGRGKSWAVQTDNMEITLNFDFELYLYERNLILAGYFPKPAGFALIINDTTDN
jgi:hypothetical protein